MPIYCVRNSDEGHKRPGSYLPCSSFVSVTALPHVLYVQNRSVNSIYSVRRPICYPARRAIRPNLWRACHRSPYNSEEEGSKPSEEARNNSGTREHAQNHQSSDSQMATALQQELAEMDRVAESWIGTDLSRWEWYERLRSRRSKMLSMVEKNEAQLDEDMEQLRRTLMELDAVLGTKFLNEDSNISPTGWGVLFTVLALYVGVGYTIVQGIVFAITTLMPGSSFP